MNREARTETPFRRAGGPPRALLIAMAIVLGVPSWGCVTVAEHRKLERRVKDMQRSQAGDESRVGVANLVAEMDEMRAEIRGLRGQIEETEKRAAQALEEAKKARREAAAAAIGARSPGATPEGDPTSSGGTAAAVAGAEARRRRRPATWISAAGAPRPRGGRSSARRRSDASDDEPQASSFCSPWRSPGSPSRSVAWRSPAT